MLNLPSNYVKFEFSALCSKVGRTMKQELKSLHNYYSTLQFFPTARKKNDISHYQSQQTAINSTVFS